jgi:hypothetical protein
LFIKKWWNLIKPREFFIFRIVSIINECVFLFIRYLYSNIIYDNFGLILLFLERENNFFFKEKEIFLMDLESMF